MEWQDQGILLSTRRHGEGAAIIEVLSADHGRHLGLVRGGGGRKAAPLLQPGNQLALTWRARLEEQLGSFSVELHTTRSAALLANKARLYAFNAMAAMLSRYLPEREPNPALYTSAVALLDKVAEGDNWRYHYCRFELDMLETLGYGVDLSRCAVSGQDVDLAYVSPKTGRAVSRAAAKGWEARLLPLPGFLRSPVPDKISASDFSAALRLSGYFFAHFVPGSKPDLPEARRRLQDMVEG